MTTAHPLRENHTHWEDPSISLSAGPVFSRAAGDDDPPYVPPAPLGFAPPTTLEETR